MAGIHEALNATLSGEAAKRGLEEKRVQVRWTMHFLSLLSLRFFKHGMVL